MNKDNKSKSPEFVMKMAFVGIGVAVILAFIVGSWVWNLIFDPAQFNLYDWLNKSIFNSSIAIAMMVLGFIAVEESIKAKENGNYVHLMNVFNSLVETLYETNRIIYFDQFIPWLADKQLREKKIQHLTKHGMGRMEAEAIVDYATIDDLEVISGCSPKDKPTEHYGKDVVKKNKKGEDVLIPAIKGTQACYVEDVLTDKIVVNVENSSYYLTASRRATVDLSSLETAQQTDKERVRSMRVSFITKGLTGVVYSLLLSLLVVDINTGAGSAEALWNLLQRIVTATLGFVGGGFAGSTDMKYVCHWIKDKMKVVRDYNKYLDAGEFKPKTYAETSKDRIKAAKEATDIKPTLVEVTQ